MIFNAILVVINVAASIHLLQERVTKIPIRVQKASIRKKLRYYALRASIAGYAASLLLGLCYSTMHGDIPALATNLTTASALSIANHIFK